MLDRAKTVSGLARCSVRLALHGLLQSIVRERQSGAGDARDGLDREGKIGRQRGTDENLG